MKKIKESPGHPEYMSDERKSYACVPKGTHYVAFEVPKEYGVSIPFARKHYEGGINLIPNERE